MKNFFLFLLFLLPIQMFAESSEDIYTIDSACALSGGIHFGQIPGLQNDKRFNDVITDSYYSISTFLNQYDPSLGGKNLFFVVNSPGEAGNPKYAELFLVNCSSTNSNVYHFSIHRGEPNIQYSPEISRVTSGMILLDDWQNIGGMSYHVSTIQDRKDGKIYQIRDSLLLKNDKIKSFVGSSQIHWNVLGYSRGNVRVEVRVSPTRKKVFSIKLS